MRPGMDAPCAAGYDVGTAVATRAAAAKSCPHLAQTVTPRLIELPHAGQSRVFGRLMNQISEKNTKPTKPIRRINATPIPLPASAAFWQDWLLKNPAACWTHCATSWWSELLPPAIAQITMRAHHTMSTQVIFRQRGLGIAILRKSVFHCTSVRFIGGWPVN